MTEVERSRIEEHIEHLKNAKSRQKKELDYMKADHLANAQEYGSELAGNLESDEKALQREIDWLTYKTKYLETLLEDDQRDLVEEIEELRVRNEILKLMRDMYVKVMDEALGEVGCQIQDVGYALEVMKSKH